jgi:hypothetical protein
MGKAVELKGPQHSAPGAYRCNGQSFCIVGVALEQIDCSLVPENNHLLAFDLLSMFGCSDKVAAAGFVAQYLNDQNLEWSKVLEGFNLALEMFKPEDGHDKARDLTMRVQMKMRREVMLSRMQMDMSGYATGGYIGAPTVSNWIGGKITVNQITSTAFATLYQKDHALVA